MADGMANGAGSPSTMPSAFSRQPSAMAESAKTLIDLRPVDDVPPGVDVIGPAVLVLQVVRVLPDIDAEDDVLAVHQRTVLVRRALDGQFVAAADDPRPAASEASGRGLLQFFLQLVEAAERGIDGVGDCAGRRAAGLRSHDLPEHRMIRVSAAVVAHGGPDVLGDAVDAFQQIL